MADNNTSLSLIEELGFAPSEHQFLLRLLSSDPFSELSPTDLETSHTQSLPLRSSNLASDLSSTSLRQDIYSFTKRPVLANVHTRGSHESSEGRQTSQYAEEWTSLIAADSDSLISELYHQPLQDNEAPHPEAPQLPPNPGTFENDVRPGSAEPTSSSIYSGESGEPPDSFDVRSEAPDQGDCEVSHYPRTLNRSGTFEELLESFPTPPAEQPENDVSRTSASYLEIVPQLIRRASSVTGSTA
ncbi:uncharacterized protein N7515_005838 [Penicillium bovifimosum]|uniref:Uncharacterized protein n=1 Tax=Penicillium bovifimosum TaxID=126998 RepID=A0A9W9L085_9EURO|nr:uncharacterized protein N7515_005838 [Penicillium bovifimosum]KAJ5129799.1 hypothetical protein N7515_005838 [Penicillium bovifimosum]